MSDTFRSVDHFFERFPGAKEVYAAARLYHLTHSAYLPGIQVDGLQPNRNLFPAEHGSFLLQMFQRYGSGQPADADYITNRILDPSNVYLSTTQPNMNGHVGYGMPERLVFLMRGLRTLATKQSLTVEERYFAAQAFDKHLETLSKGVPSIVAIEVDPLAPSVLNNRLGRIALEKVQDLDTALEIARYVDRPYSNNIPIANTIGPEFITVFGETPPLDIADALHSVYTEPGWAASIR